MNIFAYIATEVESVPEDKASAGEVSEGAIEHARLAHALVDYDWIRGLEETEGVFPHGEHEFPMDRFRPNKASLHLLSLYANMYHVSSIGVYIEHAVEIGDKITDDANERDYLRLSMVLQDLAADVGRIKGRDLRVTATSLQLLDAMLRKVHKAIMDKLLFYKYQFRVRGKAVNGSLDLYLAVLAACYDIGSALNVSPHGSLREDVCAALTEAKRRLFAVFTATAEAEFPHSAFEQLHEIGRCIIEEIEVVCDPPLSRAFH